MSDAFDHPDRDLSDRVMDSSSESAPSELVAARTAGPSTPPDSCPRCNASLPVGKKFCGDCGICLGTSLQSEDVETILKAMSAHMNNIVDALRSIQSKAKKQHKLGMLSPIATVTSGLLIAGVGAYFTYTGNLRQERAMQLQAFEKFIPYLTGSSDQRAFALLMIRSLGVPDLAMRLALKVADTSGDVGTKQARDMFQSILDEAKRGATKPIILHAQAGIASLIVNAAERKLKQNRATYLALVAEHVASVDDKRRALEAFDSIWSEVQKECSKPELGDPGHRCIVERVRYGPSDWVTWYRDPIENSLTGR